MPKYFFVFGNNPTLSVAELAAIIPAETSMEILIKKGLVLLIETKKEINTERLIKKIGGTIKIGLIRFELTTITEEKILPAAQKLLQPKQGKFKFGFSYYGPGKFNFSSLAMKIKKYLRGQSINSRWVTSRESTLSSVVIWQNKLTSKGIEIVLIKNENKLFLGQTLTIQPFKELSFRDYGRPARDDHSGMLPPKLAQIMINLAQAQPQDIILDPFCGSGTILTEAVLAGYKNLIGSDISQKAIKDTEQNIKWIKSKFSVPNFKLQLNTKSATDLPSIIKNQTIDAIITEPYLGPQRGRIEVKKIKRELEALYTQSLRAFSQILKPNGRVVIVWPVFNRGRKQIFLSPQLEKFKIINPIPKSLRDHPAIALTDRQTIIYGRPGQKVWREIVVLSLNTKQKI
jgi:tRNA G10  N-methylase Trm11